MGGARKFYLGDPKSRGSGDGSPLIGIGCNAPVGDEASSLFP